MYRCTMYKIKCVRVLKYTFKNRNFRTSMHVHTSQLSNQFNKSLVSSCVLVLLHNYCLSAVTSFFMQLILLNVL